MGCMVRIVLNNGIDELLEFNTTSTVHSKYFALNLKYVSGKVLVLKYAKMNDQTPYG